MRVVAACLAVVLVLGTEVRPAGLLAVQGVAAHQLGQLEEVGDPAEFGAACAFLCAASSGFIVGQNLLLDGGAFNATMG